MKNRVWFLFILLWFRGSELVPCHFSQDENGDCERHNALKTLQNYENFQTIKSIYVVLETARKRKEILGCEAGDVLVCLDLDYFSVRTNGGSDPLEECTVSVYQTLMQEGFKVLRLTARGQGIYVPNGSENAKILKKLSDDLVESLGDTSVGFTSDNVTIRLDFPSDGLQQEFTQYGYYIQGTLFAGHYKAYMLGGFLHKILYIPKSIIMGDDNSFYLLGFLYYEALRNIIGDEIHLLHMPVETHIDIDTLSDSLLRPSPEDYLQQTSDRKDDLDEEKNSEYFSPSNALLEEEEVESGFSFFAFFLKPLELFWRVLRVCLGR